MKKTVEECFIALEKSVADRNFSQMMRDYWVLYYTQYPEKRKKANVDINRVSKMLSDEEKQVRLGEIKAKVDDLGLNSTISTFPIDL